MKPPITGITLNVVANEYIQNPIDIDLRRCATKEDIAFSVFDQILNNFRSSTRLVIAMDLKNLIDKNENDFDKEEFNFNYIIKLKHPFHDKKNFLENLTEVSYFSNLDEIAL